MIRIAVADDHPLFREGLRKTLSAASELQLVGEAADGQAALALCGRERPDVLVLDLAMPRCDGFGVLEQIHRISPRTRVLVLTVHLERRYEEQCLAAGAAGFLQKDSPASTIVKAVRSVATGDGVWASRRSAFRVLSRPEPGSPGGPLDRLTPREREILGLLGQGRKNREIAEAMGVSEKTVATHIASVIGKLGLRGRVEAALIARRHGTGLSDSTAKDAKS